MGRLTASTVCLKRSSSWENDYVQYELELMEEELWRKKTGHFLQEDMGVDVAGRVVDFIEANPL